MTKWDVKGLKICQKVYPYVSSVVYQLPTSLSKKSRYDTNKYFVMCSG